MKFSTFLANANSLHAEHCVPLEGSAGSVDEPSDDAAAALWKCANDDSELINNRVDACVLYQWVNSTVNDREYTPWARSFIKAYLAVRSI